MNLWEHQTGQSTFREFVIILVGSFCWKTFDENCFLEIFHQFISFPKIYGLYRTRNQIILTKQSGRVTKILTASRILQISIARCQIKAKIHSFPTMYIIGGGVNLV